MKKVLVVLVVLLAAIVPPVSAASIGRVEAPKGHLEKRRIEIDADKIRIEGNGSWWLRDNLAAMLRNRARGSGQVEIAVTGRGFEAIALTQDRIHDSRRYSAASRRQVPRGKMVAPTDRYEVSGVANISYKNRGGNFSLRGRNINASDTKVTATVRLVIEPVVIMTGLSDRGYEAEGRASRSINRNFSGGSWGNFGAGGSSASNVEAELIEEAAEKAVDGILRDFVPGPPEVTEELGEGDGKLIRLNLLLKDGGKITIAITSGKRLEEGDEIAFYNKKAEEIARYEVLAVDDKNVEVRTIKQRVRPKTEPFKIL